MNARNTQIPVTQQDLNGASFQFIYSDETYRIDIHSEKLLRWTREVGKNVGQTDEETYVLDQLSDQIVMITWIEADGLGLSNALNLENGSLTTHANQGREVFQNKGRHTLKIS